MRRLILSCVAMIVAGAAIEANLAVGQMMPGGQGPMSGRPSSTPIVPSGEEPSTPAADHPDAAARKAFNAGMKSLNKAKEDEAAAATASNPDKKAKEMEKVGDAYNRALDQFTEALSNKGDMVDAWDNVGYIHLRLGAYIEAVDDYNHVLAMKPDLKEAIEHRGEALLAVDRLDDAKAAYMDLFNHDPALAGQLMSAMQKWLTDHRADPRGMRAADVDAFGKWLLERDGSAKPTASLPH